MRAPRLRPWGCLLATVLTYLSVLGGAAVGGILGKMFLGPILTEENGFWLGAVVGGILALSSVSRRPPWGNIVTRDGPKR